MSCFPYTAIIHIAFDVCILVLLVKAYIVIKPLQKCERTILIAYELYYSTEAENIT